MKWCHLIGRSFMILFGFSSIPLVSCFSQRIISSSWTRSQSFTNLHPVIFDAKQVDESSSSTTRLDYSTKSDVGDVLKTFSLTSLIICSIAVQSIISPVYADEYGRETEAPTFFTGENVMVRYFSKRIINIY